MEKYKELYMKRVENKEESASNTLESIVALESLGKKKYGEVGMGECDCEFCRKLHGDYIYSGLLKCAPKAVDKIGHYEAFLLDKETQISGAGLEILQDFGVIIKDKIYRNGFRTVSDGRTFTKYYPYCIDIKILEIKEEEERVTIGLRTAANILEIYELDAKSKNFEKIGEVSLK